MKLFKWARIVGFIILTLPVVALSQSLDHLTLLAHYPLNSTADDTTGRYEQIELTNAPFQDGGIFCNGIYNDGSNTDACNAQTPYIGELSFKALAVSAEFKISEYPALRMPVIVCSPIAWRWLYVFIHDDSTIGLGSASDFDNVPSTKTKCELNQWQNITVTWDSVQSEMKLYFNGTAIDSLSIASLQHNESQRAGITHGGVGRTFKGWLRNLKIYSYVPGATAVAGGQAQPKEFTLAQNYPNPFNPSTTIKFSTARAGKVELNIFDLMGRNIRNLVQAFSPVGIHSATWDGRDDSGRIVASGLYLYELRFDGFSSTKMMLLLR